jgi:hypothetical protein
VNVVGNEMQIELTKTGSKIEGKCEAFVSSVRTDSSGRMMGVIWSRN